MTELVINRSSILQSKRQEISVVATARKRKLRELYAVVHSDFVPQFSHFSADSPAPTPAEAQFLEDHDITRGRNFNDSSIPTTRRLLRSDTPKNTPSRPITDLQPAGQSQFPGNGSCVAEGGQIGTKTPRREVVNNEVEVRPNVLGVSRPERAASIGNGVDSLVGQKSSSSEDGHGNLGSPTPTTGDVMPDRQISSTSSSQASGILESSGQDDEVHGNEVMAGSPGVDLKQAIPVSRENLGQLPDSFSHVHHDKHHKAVTVHLPPQEVQESHLRQLDQSIAAHAAQDREDDRLAALTIELLPPHGARLADPISSPSSTVEARSATTPGVHEASTDTSPDNEGHDYPNAERLRDGNETYPHTPPELLPSKKEISEMEEHDRLLNAQIEVAKADILGSSPTAVDAQLRLEEQAAAASTEVAQHIDTDESIRDQSKYPLPKKIEEESTEDPVGDGGVHEATGASTSEIEKGPDFLFTIAPKIGGTEEPSDVMDSDAVTAEPSPLGKATQRIHSPDKPKNRAELPPISALYPGPQMISQTPAPVHPTERMTTRVSSGAMRHKSVSEIIGEMPRASRPSSSDRTDIASNFNPASQPPSPPPSGRGRNLIQRTKERERSRLSTIVFARHQNKKDSENGTSVPDGGKSSFQEHSDYFMPLILAQAYSSARGVQPLDSLLQSAHKTITTSNAYVPFHEHQTQKILRRIHSLQAADKWSFRQPKRTPEPNRPVTHWDELLKEMKWMRTDFREERKWKMAIARNMAYACAEWVAADSKDRRLLQVKAMPPPVLSDYESEDVTMHDGQTPSAEEIPQRTPDLIPSAEHDSPQDDFDDESGTNLLDAIAPAAMFSLTNDDVVFGIRRSAATDKLLEELPMYSTPLSVPQSDLPTSEIDPDASWRHPALPLSKYVEGKIVLANDGPPKKRSRYEYEDESDEDEQVFCGTKHTRRLESNMMQVDVALFNPENKHIRDRIHAGHQFRPPSEHPMPLQSFFECRSSSHWLWSEDDELKALVREYSYNWQLISSLLSTKSLFASGAERRTPWECFERWIHLEGLPADMQKTHYFRAYNNRMESAARNLINQANQAPLSSNAAGAAVTPVRRRNTTSIRVDRKRNQKHLTLIDAMRKLAKKRETSAQKQIQAAGLAAMRKTNDTPAQQGTRHTPQDFSRLKHERELQMQERLQRMQLQQEAQRRALQQARVAQQQNPQHYSASNGIPQSSRIQASGNTPAPTPHLVNANRPNHLGVPGQPLPQGPLQPLPNGIGGQIPLPNGHGGVSTMPTKGIPQAQMQNMQGLQSLQAQHRLPVQNPGSSGADIRLVMQARQISEQQRQAVQMQQGQQIPGHGGQIHNSPPNMRANMTGMNQQNYIQSNQALMAGFSPSNPNGVSTPPANGLQVPNNGSSGSPRMNNQNNQQLHSNTNTVMDVNQLEAQYHTQYPNAPPEQIRKMVSETLKQRQVQRQQISQSAMHAAAGNGGPLPGLPGGMQHSPQQYAQMLRAQQERQAQATQQNRSASVGSGVGK